MSGETDSSYALNYHPDTVVSLFAHSGGQTSITYEYQFPGAIRHPSK